MKIPFVTTIVTDEIIKDYTDSPLSLGNVLSNCTVLTERDLTGILTSAICIRKLHWSEKDGFIVEFWRYDSKGRWLYKEPISVLKSMEIVPEGFSINSVLACINVGAVPIK